MKRSLALIFVGLAGVFWASSGVAVQDFFMYSEKSAYKYQNVRCGCDFDFNIGSAEKILVDGRNFAKASKIMA